MSKEIEPAFPCAHQDNTPGCVLYTGMSLRDYFAAAALQGMLAGDRTIGYPTACENAYGFADAMLAERDK